MRPLSPREARLVAVGLLVLAVALVWLVVIAPIVAGFTSRAEERDVLAAQYAVNATQINAIPVLSEQAAKQKPMLARFALGGPNVNVARAALRDRLQRDVTAAGGQVTAVQDVPAPAGEVRAWVQARVSMVQLQALLVRVADTPPYLVTRALRVSADRVLDTGKLDQVDIRLEASIPYIPAAS